MALTSVYAQQNAPNQTNGMINYTPQYQGLMGGDYDNLQNSLSVGGKIAANNVYNTGRQHLTNTMSGKGLYGSSIMQQQQIQGLDREYMDALAKNEAVAAATRYGMQQTDLGKASDVNLATWQGLLGSNTDIYKTDVNANTALAGYKSAQDIANANNAAQLAQTQMQTTSAQKIADANNIIQKYGIDSQQGTEASKILAQERMNTADNTTTLANTGLLTDSQQKISDANNATTLANTGLQTNSAQKIAEANNIIQKYGIDSQQGIAASKIISDEKIAQGNNTTVLDSQRLQNAGTLANTTLQGQNATTVQTLQNTGQLANTTQQGLNAKVIQELQNTGLLANTTLNNTSAEGIASANRDLQNVTAINNRQSAEYIAGLDSAAKKYAADIGLQAEQGKNTTNLAIAAMTDATTKANIQAQISAAQAKGDLATLTALGAGLGFTIKNWNDVVKFSSWVGNLGSGLMSGGDMTTTYSDPIDASNEI